MKKTIAFLAALAIIFTLALPASALSKPSSPKLTSVKNTSSGILLKWKTVKNAEKYLVYRKTSNVRYSKIASVKTTSFTHKGAVSGKKYAYKIFAVNSKGKSAASREKTITRVGTPSLKTTNTAYAIKVSWSKVSRATSYVLLCKKTSAKKYTVLYRGGKLSYSNDNIESGAEYNFKVKAVIGKLRGAYSAVKSQMFLERTSLSAEEYIDMKGITLEWTPVTNAKGYIIYRSLKSENSYKRIFKTKTASTQYVDSDVVGINSYKYYVIAYNGSYKSAASNIDGDVYGYLTSFDTPLLLTIKKGEVYKDIYNKLKYYGATTLVTWSSQNDSTVKVSVDGIITGVKKGSATLKAVIDPTLFAAFGKSDIKDSKTVTIIVTVK